MIVNNLMGQRFGKLIVVERAENSPSGKAKWYCKCECGNTKKKAVLSYDLIAGKVKSCGCLYIESNKGRNSKHNMTHKRLYNVWLSMRQRCGDGGRYSAKKITVCEEWKRDFQAFYDWSMANGYRDDLTLDRIHNNVGYCPENCRWATMKEQQNNRTNNRIVLYNGNEFTVAELAAFLDIPYATLLWRINNGWEGDSLGIKPNYKNKSIRRKINELN